MRELTDRELDAVCGGFAPQLLQLPTVYHQVNRAIVQPCVSQRRRIWLRQTSTVIGQSNVAINTNIF